jgi:hypothetical protein
MGSSQRFEVYSISETTSAESVRVPAFTIMKQPKTRREQKREERLEAQREERQERNFGASRVEQMMPKLIEREVMKSMSEEMRSALSAALSAEVKNALKEIEEKIGAAWERNKEYRVGDVIDAEFPEVDEAALQAQVREAVDPPKIRAEIPLDAISARGLSRTEDIECFCAEILWNTYRIPCEKVKESPIISRFGTPLKNWDREFFFVLQPERGTLRYFEDFDKRAISFEWTDDGTIPGVLVKQPALRPVPEYVYRPPEPIGRPIYLGFAYRIGEAPEREAPKLEDKVNDLAKVLGIDASKINAQLVARLLDTKTVEPEKPKTAAKPKTLTLDDMRAIDFNL